MASRLELVVLREGMTELLDRKSVHFKRIFMNEIFQPSGEVISILFFNSTTTGYAIHNSYLVLTCPVA